MSKFIGREHELSLLSALTEKKSASLVVIYGRRRVGKSRLIEEFGQSMKMYSFAGLAPGPGITMQSQLNEFAKQIAQQFGTKHHFTDWSDAFYELSQKTKKGRTLILLDEISWMMNNEIEPLAKLKNVWDRHFKKNNQLILVLCGSVSTWIKTNIINSTGYFGRLSLKMRLRELPLTTCKKFWGAMSSKISAHEKIKILSVTGAIPKYLEEINPKLTAEENIKRLCYMDTGLLFEEFDHIFSAMLQRDSQIYRKIVEILANKNAEQTLLLNELNLSTGGQILEYLEELEDAGFITRHFTWSLKTGKKSKLSLYRLSDNYLRFYLKYIFPNIENIINQSFQFKSLSNLPAWPSIMSLQVENLVLNNRQLIFDQLHIDPNDIIQSNPYFQRQTNRIKGCKIDFMIHTKFNYLYVCEIKFSKNVIRKDIIDEVQEKIAKLTLSKGFSVRPVLIHTSYVHDDLLASDYFSNIIDLAEMLE